jgi:Arc/MetJ-type ribon-helix-helix transcriptional regulator
MSYDQQRKTESRRDRFLAMAGLIGKFGAGAFAGSKREKLELTMGAAEVLLMDGLVEQGLYRSREEFLQSAAHSLLREHSVDVQPTADQLTITGIAIHNRKSLEKLRAAGRQLELNVTGILRLADDIAPELACAVIKQLKIRGAFQANPEVKAALMDRIH